MFQYSFRTLQKKKKKKKNQGFTVLLDISPWSSVIMFLLLKK